MGYIVIGIFVGGIMGAALTFLLLLNKHNNLQNQKAEQDAKERTIQKSLQDIKAKAHELQADDAKLKSLLEEVESRVVSFEELQNENTILKRDLRNIDVTLRKLELDRHVQQQTQEMLDGRARELGGRYLKENVKWIGSSLNTSNYVVSKKRLQDVITRCRGIGFEVSEKEEIELLTDLKDEYEKMVRATFEREEQARIKAQIREEQKLEKEIQRELEKVERERTAIQAALDKALAEAEDKHSEEIERLKVRLAEAEERAQRAESRAEMTRSGHVYIISNIGSFGEGVYKIGMTRRLEPADRVRELGDASVPFPFDVHMMIASDDAPKLEHALHRQLHKHQVNKLNPRKEFFKADIDTIRQIVEENHGEVQYIAQAEALEYRQSLEISYEDQEYIETVYDALDEEDENVVDGI